MTIFHYLKYGHLSHTKELPKSVSDALIEWYLTDGCMVNSRDGIESYLKARKEMCKKLLLEYDGPL
jgi:hypothetical protein